MKSRPVAFRSDVDIEQLDQDASLEDVITLVNKFSMLYSFRNKLLSFNANFDGYIAENVTIAAGATAFIQHYLGNRPKYRIIFRQTGNGVITDVNESWNDKIIALKNNGAEDVILTVFIARE